MTINEIRLKQILYTYVLIKLSCKYSFLMKFSHLCDLVKIDWKSFQLNDSFTTTLYSHNLQ